MVARRAADLVGKDAMTERDSADALRETAISVNPYHTLNKSLQPDK